MSKFILVGILTCIQTITFGQTIPIAYDIPPGLEKNISPEHYRLLVDTSVEVITRIDLEDTYTVLTLDLPNAPTPVQKSIFDRWKKEKAEVFRVALDTSRGIPPTSSANGAAPSPSRTRASSPYARSAAINP
jgi:hypothetical protein